MASAITSLQAGRRQRKRIRNLGGGVRGRGWAGCEYCKQAGLTILLFMLWKPDRDGERVESSPKRVGFKREKVRDK